MRVGRLITATRNSTDNTSINWTKKKQNSKMGRKTCVWTFSCIATYTYTYADACRNITTQWRRETQFSLYIPLTLFERVWEWVRPNRTATYWPHLLWPQLRFFPVLLGWSTGGLGAQPLWDMFFIPASFLRLVWSPTETAQSGVWGPTLLGAGFLYRILSPTDWTSCAPSYIIVRHPPSSYGRHK